MTIWYICHKMIQRRTYLYFFYYEGKIILTNGFIKKTQETSKEEILIVKNRRKDFIERLMNGENI